MSRGKGTGSPNWFKCWAERAVGGPRDQRGRYMGPHIVHLTGRVRPRRQKRYQTIGSRSDHFEREYVCSCGHVGWSNHLDLKAMAEEAEQTRLD